MRAYESNRKILNNASEWAVVRKILPIIIDSCGGDLWSASLVCLAAYGTIHFKILSEYQKEGRIAE